MVHAQGEPLRIAVVTETWPPEVNGVAMSLSRVVAGLLERGHAVQLVRPRQRVTRTEKSAQTSPSEGFEEVLCSSLPLPGYPELRMGVTFAGRLRRLWQRRRPDVVHLATEGPLGWSALSAARALGVPVTSDFRTNFHAYSDHYGVGWLHHPIAAYLRHFHNRTQLTMVPTDGLGEQLRARGYLNVGVVARGVDLAQFHPKHRSDALRKAWGVDNPSSLVVAYVGRLAAEKNLSLLVQAFEAIRRHRVDAHLLLVGDGPLRGELARACPDAIFAGHRSSVDLAQHYASADLFLFPSLTETFGNVTTEAMASGLPVIAFDYAAAARLMMHEVSGMLVPCGDETGFVRVAVQLSQDQTCRRVIGEHARRAVDSLGWESVVGQFEAFLRSATCAPSQSAPDPIRSRHAPHVLQAAAHDERQMAPAATSFSRTS